MKQQRGPSTSLEPDEAHRIVLEHTPTLGSETVGLEDALGRVLAEALPARLDQPRFDKAAVDGFGVGANDPGPWRDTGLIAAGEQRPPEQPWGLRPGETVRIMTGAPVPPDVSRLLRVEFTQTEDGVISEHTSDEIDNIARKGENIRAGEPLLGPRLLNGMDLGILASQGYADIPVRRRPRVAILSTGTELRSVSTDPLEAWAIYDSNGHQLTGMSKLVHCDAENRGIITDTETATVNAIGEAIDSSDVVVLSGGVSMGELDYVPGALASIGAQTVFHGVAMKPGKPVLFAVARRADRDVLVFGLPGNPVSTFVQFNLLIAPALARMQGLRLDAAVFAAPLASGFSRGRADRHEYRPARLEDGRVVPIDYQGSGHLSALADADVMYHIPRNVQTIQKGEEVRVRPIRTPYRLSPDIDNR